MNKESCETRSGRNRFVNKKRPRNWQDLSHYVKKNKLSLIKKENIEIDLELSIKELPLIRQELSDEVIL